MNIEPTSSIRQYIDSKPSGYIDKDSAKKDCSSLHQHDLGENVGVLSKKLIQNIEDIDIVEYVEKYPDPSYHDLTNSIAMQFGLLPRNITIGTGSNEVLERISRTFLDSSSRCVVLSPSFYRLEDSALRNTTNIIVISLLEENNFTMTKSDVEEIIKLKSIGLIWLCSPNNPTGTIIPLEYIKKIASAMPQTLVCVDEAWGEYIENWNTSHSAINLVEKYSNVIVTRTFSKFYGLAGLRVGYAVGSEDVIRALNSVRLEFPVNSIAQEIVLCVLKEKKHYKNILESVISEREKVENILGRNKNLVHISSKTSSILMRHTTKNLHQELRDRDILSSDLNACAGIEGEGWVRITVSASALNNSHLMEALSRID